MKSKMFLTLILLLSTSLIQCMDENKKNSELTVYTIPGKNGLGSHPDYVRNILNQENVTDVGILRKILTDTFK